MALIARYEGVCKECGRPIHPGQKIRPWKGIGGGITYEHVDCPDPLSLKPTETVCTECFLVKPCPCDDEGVSS